MEALVKPGVESLFRDRGIRVTRTLERVRTRRGGEEMEIDPLLVDGEALVVVEVKSTLQEDNVRDLLDNLKKFPRFFPEYRGYRLFGTVASLNFDEPSECYAYRQGLFVRTMGQEGLVTLHNDKAFRPLDFITGKYIEMIAPERPDKNSMPQ